MASQSWNAIRVGAFINAIQDDVSGELRLGKCEEHVFEALYQSMFTGLFLAVVMGRIEAGKDAETRPRLRRNLYEKRGEKAASMFLVNIPEVKVVIGDRDRPSIALSDDMLDYCRADGGRHKLPHIKR